MPIIGSLETTIDYQEIPLEENVGKNDLYIVMCNLTGSDVQVSLTWNKGDKVVPLYSRFSLSANETYPSLVPSFRVSLGVNDKIYVKSNPPGVVVSLLK